MREGLHNEPWFPHLAPCAGFRNSDLLIYMTLYSTCSDKVSDLKEISFEETTSEMMPHVFQCGLAGFKYENGYLKMALR